jgi:branched-chain amino acid transport system substrate-binding protein
MNVPRRHFVQGLSRLAAVAAVGTLLAGPALAQKRYDPGASDTEIKIGNIGPYSGPASAWSTFGKVAEAYVNKVNAEGGINGRKIKFVTLDDGYNPAKTLEQARKLVEEEQVLAIWGVLGTTPNLAIQRYMNQKQVPQLFLASGATRFGDPKNFPWSMGWQPSYQQESRLYAQHILQTRPNAKIAVLMQNDDFGKDYYKGLVDGLGDKAKAMIVQHATFELTDATIDSQVFAAKASGADVFFNIASPKFAAQAIKKAAEIGWKPTQYLVATSQSIAGTLKPAGLENATGLLTVTWQREPSDPSAQDSKDVKDFLAFMKQYYPAGDPNDSVIVTGYCSIQTMVQVLRQAGDNLTRENLMTQAASLNTTVPMLYPGVELKTSADDFHPIKKVQMVRFNGTRYEAFGLSAASR